VDHALVGVALDVPAAMFRPYFLMAGPVKLLGGASAGLGQGNPVVLWDAIGVRLLPRLREGLHHVRCAVSHEESTVHVDGHEWVEGSDHLRLLAHGGSVGMKQHLLIRPADLPRGIVQASPPAQPNGPAEPPPRPWWKFW
jgi:hypothetical protein